MYELYAYLELLRKKYIEMMLELEEMIIYACVHG